jgi:TonB family protein
LASAQAQTRADLRVLTSGDVKSVTSTEIVLESQGNRELFAVSDKTKICVNGVQADSWTALASVRVATVVTETDRKLALEIHDRVIEMPLSLGGVKPVQFECKSSSKSRSPEETQALANNALLIASLQQSLVKYPIDTMFTSSEMNSAARAALSKLLGKYGMENAKPQAVQIMPDGVFMTHTGKLFVYGSEGKWFDPVELAYTERGTFPKVEFRGGKYDLAFVSDRFQLQIENGFELRIDGVEWVFAGGSWRLRNSLSIDVTRSPVSSAGVTPPSTEGASSAAGRGSAGNGAAGRTMPSPISMPTPPYPAEMRKRKVEGKVMLEVLIKDDGSVSNVRVLRGVSPELDESAVTTVKTWKFKPATENGLPVNMRTTVEINFVLRQ